MTGAREMPWQNGHDELPLLLLFTVAAYSVANRLCIGHTYIVLLWQDVLPSRLTAAFDHNRHLPPYLYSAVNVWYDRFLVKLNNLNL